MPFCTPPSARSAAPTGLFPPLAAGKPLDIRALYAAVRNRGGCDAVTAARAWPAVATVLGLQDAVPDVAAALRSGGAASTAAALKCAPFDRLCPEFIFSRVF